jgi:hypothetical protein
MIEKRLTIGAVALVAGCTVALLGTGARAAATASMDGAVEVGVEAVLPAIQSALDASRPVALDFDAYRRTVEPILMRDRGRVGVGGACVTCHTWQATTPMRLERLQVRGDGEVYWTEEQSRRNFDAVTRLVTPGRPEVSRLLVKPLVQSAGGAAEHTGGKFWDSTDDPEYRAIAAWVRAGAGSEIAAADSRPPLDFEFFRGCVQKVFLNERPGLVKCASCHTGGSNGFARTIGDGRDFWNEEESRANFAIIQRLVDRGNPDGSRFLTHPLALAAGGDNMHNGGRRWQSKEDPEWRMLAAWVRGERPQCVL